MSVSITGRHVVVTPALRRYVEDKVERLNRFGLDLHQVQVIIAVEKFRHHAEVICVLNRRRYRAKASSKEMYASIDLMVDKIERQLRDKKSRLVSHKGKGRRRPVPVADEDAAPQTPVVSVVRATAPMLLRDEAIGLLARHPDRPVVFVDEESQELSVLQKLPDGRLELMVPQRKRVRGGG